MDDATRKLYEERGLGRRQGAGKRPAVVVVDLNNGFTDPASPLYCDADVAVPANIRVLEAARAAGCPVVVVPYGYREGIAVQALRGDGIVDSIVDVANGIAARRRTESLP